MAPRDINNPAHFRWSRQTGRVINGLCFVVLLLVIGTVIYGLLLRARYEQSYYGAAVLAVLGAFVMLIGLAQQAIASRDAATWREMAEWQLRAAHAKAMRATSEGEEPDSIAYHETLVEALIHDMLNKDAEGPAREQ